MRCVMFVTPCARVHVHCYAAHASFVRCQGVSPRKTLPRSLISPRISAILKFGAGTGEDPFEKVKGLITELISQLQEETSSEASQRTYCDEATSKANEKEVDPEADIAKHSSKLRHVPTGQSVRKPMVIHQVQIWTKLLTWPLLSDDRYPWPRLSRKP